MQVLIDPNRYEDYELLLRAKSIPKYEVRGCRLVIPDEYAHLLGGKPSGRKTLPYNPASYLYDYQKFFAKVAVKKKKFCLFWDCGLGKTAIQLEFARHCSAVLPKAKKVLIVTPLMVIPQFLSESTKFYGERNLVIEQVPSGSLEEWSARKGGCRIGITNWEAFKKTVARGNVEAVVMDEVSIWKNHYGTIGKNAINYAKGIEWKLAGTGTPAPNDSQEYANHALFVDAFRSTNEFLARYFVNRGETANRWELRPHAQQSFYREISHWCVFLTNPATYGFDDNSSTIPPINVHIEGVPLTDSQKKAALRDRGVLFAVNPGGITGRSKWSNIAKGRHNGQPIATNKPAAIKAIVDAHPDESIIIWCLYNHEQDSLAKFIGNSCSISGSTPSNTRIKLLDDFRSKRVQVLITKPKILGFGLNLQVCTRMIFSGLQDSYESYYQAVKRANRIGSTKPLNVHIPVTDIERPMIETVLRKASRVHQESVIQERLFNKECLYHV